jgi:hypothetical protein
MPLVLGPLNSLVWYVPSLRYTRGLGWRMHCGAEVTESSTNKQHHLSITLGANATTCRRQAIYILVSIPLPTHPSATNPQPCCLPGIDVSFTNNSNVAIDVIIFTFYSHQLTIDVETGMLLLVNDTLIPGRQKG